MAIFFDAAVEPDDLTIFTREVPVPAELRLLNEFPRRDLETNTVDFAEIVRTNRTARFRTYDGRIHVSERDVGSEKRVKMIPLSTSLSMGEYERLQLEFARLGGQNQQALARAIYNEGEQLTREVQNRLEQGWGSLLTTGKLTVPEIGAGFETDYGLAALGNLVTPSVTWSAANLATMTPLTDIQTWSDAYRLTNGGVAPARMKTSLATLRIVQRSKEVIDAIYGATQGRTRVTLAQLNDLLAGEGLPTFDEPYDASFDVDGVTTRTVPEDRVALLPASLAELGYTAWGVTATALELVNSSESDLSFENAPGIVGVVEKVGPPYREFTYVDAVAMPILANARRLMIADVR
ncbi:major capsid protein [Nocardioides sp. SOB77]|uniref:Major capsid protein n=1 Tax=Nocardioides oceani TaxID=3058369 RepID=A0ABT8FJ66_9ACTN|nr:major capsid protein [Nocardioides oceani]MDN4174728.1 major capsid protein [Nocardioides oceani]